MREPWERYLNDVVSHVRFAFDRRKIRQELAEHMEDLYEDLLTLREPPMRILFLIARQFNQLLLVRELQASGADRGTVASKLKVPPFVAGKLSNQAAAFTKEQLISYVQTCVDAEEAVKTGRMGDRLAVELLISQPRSSVR